MFHACYGFLLLIKKPVPIWQYFYTDPAMMEKKHTRSSLACSRVEWTISGPLLTATSPDQLKVEQVTSFIPKKKTIDSESYVNGKQAMDVYFKKLTPSEGIIGSLKFWVSIAVLWVM